MPTKVLSDMRLIASGLMQDQAGKLPVTTRNQAIAAAVRLHSNAIPAIKFQVVTGVSNSVARTPTGWVDQVSQIAKIEYPMNERPPSYLEEDDFQVIMAATAATQYRILFTSTVPGATAPFGVIFSAPHTFGSTASQNTIPDHHIDAVAHLSASIACQQLAAFYSQSHDSLIQSDSVNNSQKLPNYLQLSKAYRDYYMTFFRLDEKNLVKPASIIKDIDRRYQWGGDFFYHSRRWR